jgi:hypothetical protein
MSTMKIRSIIIVASIAMLLLLSSAFTVLPNASAASPNLVLDSSTCTNNFGASWDSTSSTCTITLDGYLSSGQRLNIPSGTTLAIQSDVHDVFFNYGTVNNDGTITISNTGPDSKGFVNFGTVSNDGTITISNTGPGSQGFINFGTVSNDGTITISNTGAPNQGFLNYGTVKSDGTITISNSVSGSIGFFNFGTVESDGTITISNSGTASQGFYNCPPGSVSNDGTITISNSADSIAGFHNFGTVKNDGMISTCGSSGNGFVNESGCTYRGNPVVTSC